MCRCRRGRGSQIKEITHTGPKSPQSVPSVLSTNIATPAFFNSSSFSAITPSAVPPQAKHPKGQASTTWKSAKTIEREKYDRTRQQVQHFAPEQFKACAKPSNGPAGIVPRTVHEFKMFKHELSLEQMKTELAAKEARQKMPKDLPEIMAAFNGKALQANRSAVLSQSSIWSQLVQPTIEHPRAAWPGRDELHEDGGKRESIHSPTRCGRFLPALRDPHTGNFTYQYPLDQVGPIRSQGPTPRECEVANDEFNFDTTFEEEGAKLLDSELLKEIGECQPPFVPDWLAEKRCKQQIVSAQYYQRMAAFEEW